MIVGWARVEIAGEGSTQLRRYVSIIHQVTPTVAVDLVCVHDLLAIVHHGDNGALLISSLDRRRHATQVSGKVSCLRCLDLPLECQNLGEIHVAGHKELVSPRVVARTEHPTKPVLSQKVELIPK